VLRELHPRDAAPSRSADLPRVVVVNKFPPGEVTRAALALLGLLVAVYLLWRIQEVLFLLFLAVLLATAIEPIVNRLRRGPFTRGSGVLAVYSAIVLVLSLVGYAVLPSVAAQGGAFTETLPQRVEALQTQAQNLRPTPLRDAATAALGRVSEELVAAGETAAHGIISFLTVFVLAFYWLVERATIKRALLRAVPVRHARSVNTVWLEVEDKLGGWVRGQLLLMLAIGVMAGVGYSVIGLPNPAVLAVAAGLFEIVPMIGPVLAFTPAVLVALAADPSKALIVLVYAIIIQQIESQILVPRVMRHAVGVSPLTVLLGILAGAALAGLAGAFLAVPLAAAAQVILAHVLRVEDPAQAEEHATPRGRAQAQSGGGTGQAPGSAAARADA
jgi:predicted PurR-regulated permease PerM